MAGSELPNIMLSSAGSPTIKLMNRTYTPAQPRKMPLGLLLIFLVGAAIYSSTQYQIGQAQPYVYATTAGGLTFSYEVTGTDVTVDWSGGGDFDPRDKCPEDFSEPALQ